MLGAISWFAVHPTSMNNTNPLVSSDNMGYASILLEQAMNPKGTLPGQVHHLLCETFYLYSMFIRCFNVFILGKIRQCICIIEFGGCFSKYYGSKVRIFKTTL